MQDKAFKELAAGVPPSISASAKSLDGHTNPAASKFCSEFHVPGQNIPLDLFKDVCFTMPLCRSKVDQDTVEDLIELAEIERHNVGTV